ncbi:MAG TPA: tetratricopeptide repeat protein [Candidatus Methylacidiphilales bacterium]|nr:tetratricopeptide repeat protein [Candidatus Methylacidiphilales bacterium]
MSRRLCLSFAGLLALVTCNLFAQQDTQYDDSRNPYYKQAEQDLDSNNPAAAVNDYQAALAADPKLAEAHYQLGVVYGDKLNDPVGAIYHYRQYLALDPASDKSGEVRDKIQKLSFAFAATIPNSPAQTAAAFAKLQADNATLKKQVADAAQTIAQLQVQLAASAAANSQPASAGVNGQPASATTQPPLATSGPGPAPGATSSTSPPVPPRALPLDATNAVSGSGAANANGGANRTYKVVSGDSLWKISHKMYPGDTKNGIDKIKDANKDILIEGKPLKIGQVLVIPP